MNPGIDVRDESVTAEMLLPSYNPIGRRRPRDINQLRRSLGETANRLLNPQDVLGEKGSS